jgi:hypothetical protein
MQEHAPSEANSPSSRQTAALSAVRRRGMFLAAVLLWTTVLAGALAMGGVLSIAANSTLNASERFRQALGFQIPSTGPDWYVLAVFMLMISVPTLVLIGFLVWYRRIWRRRLSEVWVDSAQRRRHSPIQRLERIATPKTTSARTSYLNSLKATPMWIGVELPSSDPPDGEMNQEARYRLLAEAMLTEIENDVAERAIATGLIVALGSSRVDRLTIIAAALEMQLHVLSRLGKKPSRGTWRAIWARTSESLFINTYLNREDTLAIQFFIRRAAMGLEWTGGLIQDASDMLSEEGGGEESIDEVLEIAGGVPFGIGGALKALGTTGLGISATGLQSIADLIREGGDELLQGAIAGGVLYYHGMAIAADVLALDATHRESPSMTRTPLQGAMKTAATAGQLLRNQVLRYRGVYRERAKASFRGAKQVVSDKLTRRKRAQNQLSPAPPPTSSDESSGSPDQGAKSRRWNPLRKFSNDVPEEPTAGPSSP